MKYLYNNDTHTPKIFIHLFNNLFYLYPLFFLSHHYLSLSKCIHLCRYIQNIFHIYKHQKYIYFLLNDGSNRVFIADAWMYATN